MKEQAHADRRAFVQGAAAAAFAGPAFLAMAGPSGGAVAPDGIAAVNRLVCSVFKSPASAAVIGRVFLREHPHEGDLGLLIGRVWQASADREDPADRAPEGLRLRLAEAIRADFAASRTTSVDGWLFSLTEARLCALAALAGGGAASGGQS